MGGQENCGFFTEGVLFKILKKAAHECRVKIILEFFECKYEIRLLLILNFGNDQQVK